MFRCDKNDNVMWSVKERTELDKRLYALEVAVERLNGTDERIRRIEDLVCKHVEVWKRTPLMTFASEAPKYTYYCSRCGKKMDAAKIGEAELEKRIKKEGL